MICVISQLCIREKRHSPTTRLFNSRRDPCVANGKIVPLALRNTSRWVREQNESRFLRNGRERPYVLFGRLKAEKVGSLPPNLMFFPVSVFSFSCRLFPRFPEPYAHPKLRKMEKTKLK